MRVNLANRKTKLAAVGPARVRTVASQTTGMSRCGLDLSRNKDRNADQHRGK